MKFLMVILIFSSTYYVKSNFCYWNTGCLYKYFASKTPYNLIRGDLRDNNIKLTDCEPVSIWGLLRHGKTYPEPNDAFNMKHALAIKDHVVSNCENSNCSLCAQDVENLNNWITDDQIFNKVNQLTEEGFVDSVGIGKRLKQTFPKLLAQLNKDEYTFRPTEGKFIEDSLKGFTEGLGIKQVFIQPSNTEFDFIAPYLKCEQYQNEVRNNPATYKEVERYRSSSDFLAAKDRLTRRLGFDHSLTNENITAIYDLCRYTTSGIDVKFSPWCALFTTEDLKVLEYIGDLEHYYRNGYGTPINALFGQIALSDLLKSFQAAKNGNGKKITAYVSHATMIDMAYTALNIYQDDGPLTGAPRKQDRKWRSSKLSAFSSNIMAVLNKCEKKEGDEFNVVFYLNEEPLLPICKEGVCGWEEFEDKLSSFFESDFC